MKGGAKEMLLGHSTGLDYKYYRPTSGELLQEDRKAIDALTINEENRLRKKVEELTPKSDEIQAMKAELKVRREQSEKLGLAVDEVKSLYRMRPRDGKRTTRISTPETNLSRYGIMRRKWIEGQFLPLLAVADLERPFIGSHQSLGIFVTQTANNFPEFLYTLIFQIEYKILLRNCNVDNKVPAVVF